MPPNFIMLRCVCFMVFDAFFFSSYLQRLPPETTCHLLWHASCSQCCSRLTTLFSSDQHVFTQVCGLQELVEAALDGYSVTIFAFGQTGSGKTHTMIGPRLSRAGGLATVSGKEDVASLVVPDDGVLPRCMAAAYAGIEQRSDTTDYTVSVSCIELYNEAVTDLLGDDKSKQLQVRKEASGSFRVDGLSQTVCKTAGGALKTMAKALQFRHTRAHALNNYSSRSHCLMTFNFASKEKQAAEGQAGSQGGLRRWEHSLKLDTCIPRASSPSIVTVFHDSIHYNNALTALPATKCLLAKLPHTPPMCPPQVWQACAGGPGRQRALA